MQKKIESQTAAIVRRQPPAHRSIPARLKKLALTGAAALVLALAPKALTAESTLTVLKNFDYYTSGGNPQAGLVQGSDGALYGTTQSGGSSGNYYYYNSYGTLFKVNPDGSGFTVLKDFDYSTTGAYPQGELMQGSDGALYGTTQSGGTYGSGTLFKVNRDGTGFTVLKNFDYYTTGGNPNGRLIQGSDGALYGTARNGGSSGNNNYYDPYYYYYHYYYNYGTLFKINPDGTGFTVLKTFDNYSYSTAGAYPKGGLTQGSDGALYGTTENGGSNGSGALFKLNPDGTGYTVLKNFDYYTTGGNPQGGLVQGSDGALYGTTFNGGSSSGNNYNYYPYYYYNYASGTLFKVNTDGTGFTVLKNFDSQTTGSNPQGGLVKGPDGTLYGTTQSGGSSENNNYYDPYYYYYYYYYYSYGTLFKVNPDGTGFTVLKNFNNSYATGTYPRGGLVRGSDGALYGTTQSGGSYGSGTVFRLGLDSTANDSIPPVLNLPGNLTVEATGSGGAVSTFSASATDAVDGSVTVTLSPASGSTFPLGTTTVTATATDAAGNTATGSFTVTVRDTTAPVLSLPASMAVEATGPNGANATFVGSASDLVSGAVAVSFSPAPGTTFPLGTTTVNATARDSAGNTASGSFTITVRDTTAPVLSLPASATVEATGPGGAPVTFTGSATDLVSGAVAVSFSPASGSTFPLGTTTVTATATDAAGNIATGSFTVTVRDTTAPVLSLPSSGVVEATGPSGASVNFTGSASDLVSGAVAVSFSPGSGSTFPLGTTTVTAAATDAAGNTATGSFTVTVRDTTAPVITSLTTSTAVLWPANHKMVSVSVAASATDAVSPVTGRILSVTSNEPDNGLGDGDTAGDIVITGAGTVSLRAERAGQGNGRVYTIVFEASDNSGNKSNKTVTVLVPKSQGK